MIQIKNILITLAIIILTTFVVVYGVETFYPRPQFDDFCGSYDEMPRTIEKTNASQIICAEDTKQCPDGSYVSRDPENACQFAPCNTNFQTCNEEYESARKPYSRNFFIITTILGVILVILGALIFGIEAIGAGIMGGGIITLIYGSGQYWRYSGNAFRFVISLIGLGAVIYLAYWLNKKHEKK